MLLHLSKETETTDSALNYTCPGLSRMETTSQFHNHMQYLKVYNSGRPLENQTWQTEWKTAPLAKVQLCEYENQTLEVFVGVSQLNTVRIHALDCPVACQNSSLLAAVLI